MYILVVVEKERLCTNKACHARNLSSHLSLISKHWVISVISLSLMFDIIKKKKKKKKNAHKNWKQT